MSFIEPVALLGGNTAVPLASIGQPAKMQNKENTTFLAETIFCIGIDSKNDFKLVLKHLFARKS